MPVYLNAIAAQFYRGIGPETQYITGFSEMNFFIGPNNAGKSVVLNLIHDRLPFGSQTQNGHSDLTSTEAYRGAETGKPVIAIGFPEQEAGLKIKVRPSLLPSQSSPRDILKKTLSALSHKGFVWLKQSERKGSEEALLHPVRSGSLQEAIRVQQSGRSVAITFSMEEISRQLKTSYPPCLLIPAKRKLGPKDETFDDQSGKGLINHLAAMQNPDHHGYAEKRKTFDQINEFVRAVTGKPDAQLNVPDNKEHLLIHMDNKVLPLDSLGTGIHEVILIAAFCTIHQHKIMCIEEPEIHLHPVLQRKLIRYLQEKTENQYFIATHSAAFIDTPNASVYRVHNDGVQTYVSPALLRGEMRQICDDLGYKASDIMQANAVIWVEGPSDRIYLRHWISAVDPALIEGIHYSILFYGGALIKHLSADDDAVTDFIKLQELNRNFAVVLDSDKETAESDLKLATKRIKDELEKAEGIAWITEGREVENYVNPDPLQAALKATHPDIYGAPSGVGQFDHAFYFRRSKPDKKGETLHKTADKVGVATKVCETAADLTILGLESPVKDLVAMITAANKV